MEEKMFADPKFKKHASGVIATVNVAIGMLGPNLDDLVVVLKDLGKKHVRYGVLEAHYPVVGGALIGTLTDALGEAFTPEVKAAWEEIWGVISSTMIAGAEY
jgi:hemoglobin-like flavoprotein